MGHYGAPTPKPQQGWTNSRQFAKIRKGKWSYSDNAPSSVKTVKKTICKTSGKSSYCGTPELKASQSGTYICYSPRWYLNDAFVDQRYSAYSDAHLIRKNSYFWFPNMIDWFTKDLPTRIRWEDPWIASRTCGNWWGDACSGPTWVSPKSFRNYDMVNLGGSQIGTGPEVFKGQSSFGCPSFMDQCFSNAVWDPP